MEKNKVRFLKEKEIEQKAQKNALLFENTAVQNPIKAKFLAFLKTKNDFKKDKLKDIF